MSNRENKNIIIYLFLRFGVVVFIASILFQIARAPGLETQFWNDFIQVLSGIAFIVFSVMVFAMPKHAFNVFGFFLVAVGSFYMLMHKIIIQNTLSEAAIYLFLIIVAFYFMTKGESRSSHRSSYF
jgi:uncharacterized membrane protein YhaH (DUF805 family)